MGLSQSAKSAALSLPCSSTTRIKPPSGVFTVSMIRADPMAYPTPWAGPLSRSNASGRPRRAPRLRSGQSPRRPMLALDECLLALEAPAVSRNRAILLNDPVTGNHDGQRVCRTGFGHLARLSGRADPGSDLAVVDDLAGRDFP